MVRNLIETVLMTERVNERHIRRMRPYLFHKVYIGSVNGVCVLCDQVADSVNIPWCAGGLAGEVG